MITTESAEHYRWGDGCDGWHLLRAAGAVSVIEERMPPGTAEVRHYHQRARQFFYILRGTATMELGDRAESLPPRSGIEIAPGVPHRMRNRGDEPLEFLVISVPPSHGDRVVVEEER